MLANEIRDALLLFRRERDWEKFHSVKNLSVALSIEASELLEIFQWSRDEELDRVVAVRRKDVEREIADIAIVLTYLCYDLKVDLADCVRKKLNENAKKYPVAKARGTAAKYDQL